MEVCRALPVSLNESPSEKEGKYWVMSVKARVSRPPQ